MATEMVKAGGKQGWDRRSLCGKGRGVLKKMSMEFPPSAPSASYDGRFTFFFSPSLSLAIPSTPAGRGSLLTFTP